MFFMVLYKQIQDFRENKWSRKVKAFVKENEVRGWILPDIRAVFIDHWEGAGELCAKW